MADGVDQVAAFFSREIPQKDAPVDQRGKMVETPSRPETMFQERSIEGDESGDISDGGENEAYRAREREIADGDEGGTRGKAPKEVKTVPDDEGDDDDQVVAQSDDEPEADDGEKYEITVEGKPYEVTLAEALRGYVRQATFHQRVAQLNQANVELETNAAQLRQGWAEWSKARADYEEDLASLIPQEPNWDQEFARDPQAAHAQQKIFHTLYGKLAQSRQLRANREAAEAAETDRRIQKYAIEGQNKFWSDNRKDFPDEKTWEKEKKSMRRTALDAGFNEYETATVFDPRMLTVLWWASKFRRMTANLPKALIPGKGKTLTPGAATPLSGNARRKGFDDAQRKLAQTGRLDDAAEVFRRML
jgi:hypothetical protein